MYYYFENDPNFFGESGKYLILKIYSKCVISSYKFNKWICNIFLHHNISMQFYIYFSIYHFYKIIYTIEN
jgi:hypothetical protein